MESDGACFRLLVDNLFSQVGLGFHHTDLLIND